VKKVDNPEQLSLRIVSPLLANHVGLSDTGLPLPATEKVNTVAGSSSRLKAQTFTTTSDVKVLHFDIDVRQTPSSGQPSQEKLWSFLLRRYLLPPVLVRRYPILRRPDSSPGLEVTFDILLEALGSGIKITSGKDDVRLSSTRINLELVMLVDDIFYWHELHGEGSSPCASHSFEQNGRKTDLSNIKVSVLEKSRHVLCQCEITRSSKQYGKYHIWGSLFTPFSLLNRQKK
jgi:hypothetical protein